MEFSHEKIVVAADYFLHTVVLYIGLGTTCLVFCVAYMVYKMVYVLIVEAELAMFFYYFLAQSDEYAISTLHLSLIFL